MLVYESIPTNEHLQQISSGTIRSISAHSPSPPCVPSPNVNTMDMRFGSMSLHSRRGTKNRLPYYWERIVTKNNLKFSHERFQYTQGYFKFIRDMTRFAALQCKEKMADTKLAKQAIHVFACFLFSTAIRCPNDFRIAQMREWQYTIEILFENSDVAKWFITHFLIKGNIIHCAVLQPNSTLEMRKFMEHLITIPTCICMAISDSNGEEFPSADIEADSAADEIIKKILQVSKSHTMDFWNNGFHVLHILIVIASQSVQSARRLVSQNALYAMLVLLNHRDETRIRNFCRDNPHIFKFLALLFTSCTSMKKPAKDSPIIANPFSRPSKKAFFVPENAQMWFGTGSNVTRFFHLCIDSVLEIQQLLDLCCYLCWQSLPISFRLISILPLGANDASVKTTMILFKKLLEIDDIVQSERIKVACLGNEMSRIKGALVECATAAQISQINRILPVLIEFLPMTKEIPKIKESLFGNPIFSNSLEKINVCLEKFIDPSGVGGGAAATSKASWNIGIRDYLPILSDIHESLKELIAENQAYLIQNSISSSSFGITNSVSATASMASECGEISIEEAVIPEEIDETLEPTTIGMFNTTYRQRGGYEREVPRESDIR
uniref:Uncharacterized protein n=1 Tax=Panagrolaimus superbus TaxID=310955 RepID=A0A914Y2N1_9BILA